MDDIDRAIIGHVRRDVRISYADLGRAVGLSANAAADRLRRLLEDGSLRLHATADPTAQARLRVLIDLRLHPDQSNAAFETAVRRLPAVAEANHVTGAYDYVLRAEVPDAARLDLLLRELKLTAGVAATSTRVILNSTIPDD